jgi:hypothetical protein
VANESRRASSLRSEIQTIVAVPVSVPGAQSCITEQVDNLSWDVWRGSKKKRCPSILEELTITSLSPKRTGHGHRNHRNVLPVDVWLRARRHQESPQRTLVDAEIITVALTAARFFDGNFRAAQRMLLEQRYLTDGLSPEPVPPAPAPGSAASGSALRLARSTAQDGFS